MVADGGHCPAMYAARTTKTKDREPGEGGDEEAPGEPGDEGDLDGQEVGAAVDAESNGGLGAAAVDDDVEETGLVSDLGWINTALVDRVLAHKDLKRRARWPRP
jgi:hypothetical protein